MKKIDILIVFLLFFVLVGLVVIGNMILSDGAKCTQNPLVYGVKHYSDSNSEYDVSCSCSSTVPNSQVILVTKAGIVDVTNKNSMLYSGITPNETKNILSKWDLKN